MGVMAMETNRSQQNPNSWCWLLALFTHAGEGHGLWFPKVKVVGRISRQADWVLPTCYPAPRAGPVIGMADT